MSRYERMFTKSGRTQGGTADGKIRAAAYCRVSTDSRDQANSFESQQRYFREYIERNPNMELIGIYADEGISGTSTKKRFQFNQMIDDAKAGKIDLILTKEVSRFSRNTVDTLALTRELKNVGVAVLFMNDNINTLEENGEFRLTMMASIAQQESQKTSERVKWGQTRRMEQGVMFGHSMLGYDITDGVATINEEGAAIVREIFDKYVNQEKGCNTIIRELTEEGKKPLGNKGWNINHILRILRNEKYCGDLVQKKTFTPDCMTHKKKYNHGEEKPVILENHHEAIISRALFDAAQERLESRSPESSKVGHSNRYCFSGKLVCGRCGTVYVGRERQLKNGSRTRYWACGKAHAEGHIHMDAAGNPCGCRYGSVTDAEAMDIMKAVVDAMQMNRDDVIDALIRDVTSVLKQTDSSAARHKIEVQIDKLHRDQEKYLELRINGEITREEFAALREKIFSQITDLQKQADAVDTTYRTAQQREAFLNNMRAAIDQTLLSTEFTESFYRSILDRMVVYDREHVDVYLQLRSPQDQYVANKISLTATYSVEKAGVSNDTTSVPTCVSSLDR